jgi:hypothetical protein
MTTTFGFIPVEAASEIPHLRNAFIRLLKELTDACQLNNDFKGVLLMLMKPSMFDERILKTFGLYLLFKDSEIVAMALIGKMNKVDGIYVPEMHRKKGYAVELLQHIARLFPKDCEIPVFSPVASHAEKIFEKANWVCVSPPCKRDGSRDYAPLQCVDSYSRISTFNKKPSEEKWKLFQTWSMRHLMPMMCGIKKMNPSKSK